MKQLSKYFLMGALTLLPFGLTVAIVLSFLSWVDGLSQKVFSFISSDFYFPGLGIAIGLSLICLLGYFTTLPFAAKVLKALELPFRNVPILKSIYSAVKNLSDYFSPNGANSDQQVVVVRVPGFEAEFMGLVTRRDLNDMPKEFTRESRVAVFIPLSYQVGGITVFMPRSYIQRTDMKVEQAMKSALTAWMPSRDEITKGTY